MASKLSLGRSSTSKSVTYSLSSERSERAICHQLSAIHSQIPHRLGHRQHLRERRHVLDELRELALALPFQIASEHLDHPRQHVEAMRLLGHHRERIGLGLATEGIFHPSPFRSIQTRSV